MFLAAVAQPAALAQTQGPLSSNQVMVMVKAGMDTPALVKLIQEHGISFDLTGDYLEGLRKAGAHEEVIQALRATRPKPLSSDQVLALIAGGVPSKRAAVLVKEHGIDFPADNEYLEALRLAGADDGLIAALRAAGAAVTVDLVVATSPGAEVYWDGAPQGKAGNQGDFALKAHPGVHTLRVSLEAMKDFEQSVTLVARQANRIEARLEPITTELVVATSPGAELYLDGVSQGKVGAQRELAMRTRPGPHALKVSLEGKKDFERNVMLAAQQPMRIEAQLEDINPPRRPRPNATPINGATSATSFRGRIGERFAFICAPGMSLSKSVWGTGLYSDDSPVCTAAVHAGVIPAGQGGRVTIEIQPGAGSYEGSRQNGVSSRRYGRWKGSYVFVRQETEQ
jgi:hypothetical protein